MGRYARARYTSCGRNALRRSDDDCTTGYESHVDEQHVKAAAAVAAVFLLVGIVGFIPGITSHYADMQFLGHESGAELLGIFQVSVLHNIVHLLFGVLGLAMARSISGARTFLIAGGVTYLLLWIFGLLVDHGSAANFVPLNDADDWLHLGLGLGMVALRYLAPTTDRQLARR